MRVKCGGGVGGQRVISCSIRMPRPSRRRSMTPSRGGDPTEKGERSRSSTSLMFWIRGKRGRREGARWSRGPGLRGRLAAGVRVPQGSGHRPGAGARAARNGLRLPAKRGVQKSAEGRPSGGRQGAVAVQVEVVLCETSGMVRIGLGGQCGPWWVERVPVGRTACGHVYLCLSHASAHPSRQVGDGREVIRHLLLPAAEVGGEGGLLLCGPVNQSLFARSALLFVSGCWRFPLVWLAPDMALLRARASSVYPLVRGSRR